MLLELQPNGPENVLWSGSGERFVVLDHAHRSLVQVQPLEEGASGPYERCFNLTLLENHQGHMMDRLFKAPSQ